MSTHEKTDVHVPSISRYLAGLFVTLVLSMLAMWGLFVYLSKTGESGPEPTPMEAMRVVPPEPRLQVNFVQDLDQLRAKEEQLLTTYGWVDKEAGVVRIPVDRAIEILSSRERSKQ